jgi:membrane-bound lytic murein transglycosylase B
MRQPLLAGIIALSGAIAACAAAAADGQPLPRAYLAQARQAVAAHQSGPALAALDHAGTRVVETAGPPSENHQWQGLPAARAVARARLAVERQQWEMADDAISEAMREAGVWGG